jgi:hypothetical protein
MGDARRESHGAQRERRRERAAAPRRHRLRGSV